MAEKHWDWDEIPREVFDGDEEILKKRVIHFKKGARRIFVFTIVGLIMGWFSYLYVGVGFFPLKLIIAVPYKINEIIHNFFHGTHIAMAGLDTFFPNAIWVSAFTEFVLPMLFGGAIYGSLAYFTGDRKVFTYKRYLKFAGIWTLFLTVMIAATFAANHMVEKKNETLKNVKRFFISNEMGAEQYFEQFEKGEMITYEEMAD